MLTIRQEQIDTMMQPQLDKHTLAMGKAIQQHYPVFFQYYTNEQLQAWVAKQINYLKRLNIIGKSNVETIIDIIALHGENFERCPDPSWAIEILENAERNESNRCLSLVEKNDEYLAQLVLINGGGV